jgi:hypothetical protein
MERFLSVAENVLTRFFLPIFPQLSDEEAKGCGTDK